MSFGFGVGDFIAVFEAAGKARRRWVDAPVEFTSIRKEVNNVENTLRDLSDISSHVDITPSQRSNLTATIGFCSDVLAEANKLADKYTTSTASTASRARRIWTRIKADPSDVSRVRDRLVSVVAQLSGILDVIQLHMQNQAIEGIQDLKLNNDEQETLKIANWFAPASFAEQQDDQLARRQAGTGNWFLHNPEYLKWRDDANGTLFCPGIPGSGKSVMLATVVDDLRAYLHQCDDAVVAYFYCNFRRQNEQSLHQIFAALVRQLFQERSTVPQAVRDLYSKHANRGTRPSTDELYDLVVDLIKAHNNVFILVDALDECDDGEDATRSKLLVHLIGLQSQKNTNVNIMTTCRPGIVTQFKGCPQIEIRAQQEDIERYIKAHITELPACVRKSQQIQNDITQTVADVVEGMFLLARLHFDSLRDKTTIRAIRTALDKLPRGSNALDAAYHEVLARIDKQLAGFRNLARKALTWLTYARAEFTMDQLREAVAIEPGMPDIDPESDLDDGDTIVSACAGLITADQESGIVRLVHYTTQEYLERVRDVWLPDGAISVARSCMAYLSMETFYGNDLAWGMNLWNKCQKYKLLRYVGRNWGFHGRVLKEVSEVIDWLEHDSETLCFVSQLALGHYYKYRREYTCDTAEIPSLHVYAFFPECRAIQVNLDKGDDVNCVDSEDISSLHIAAHYGHNEVVAQLLAHPDIDVNIQDKDGDTPLHEAAYWGYSEVVVQLLAHPGVDLNLQDKNGWTSLHAAVYRGRSEVVAQLLARSGVDLNLQDKDGDTPLHMAASEEHSEVVAQLLTHPRVDLNLQEKDGWTPLYTAARKGDGEIVVQLLAHPSVDVNLQEKYGKTPLHVAAFEGHSEVVAQLLAHPGIEVNLHEKDGWTPLGVAVREKEELEEEESEGEESEGEESEEEESEEEESEEEELEAEELEEKQRKVVLQLLAHPGIEVDPSTKARIMEKFPDLKLDG